MVQGVFNVSKFSPILFFAVFPLFFNFSTNIILPITFINVRGEDSSDDQ